MQPPLYFNTIAQNALNRWEQLEGDPDLAAPWRQLFLQVQSPRHVLSELLQNADDAWATRVNANLNDSSFLFEHNGMDFDRDQFQSLCRFAFSNKRTLHTIGFRGVGFKSLFSLGNDVLLNTPSLSVKFNKNRFTLPIWVTTNDTPRSTTSISISIADTNRLQDFNKSLSEWAVSPMSLLFFKHIKELTINGRKITKEVFGPGPVENSQIVGLVYPDEKEEQVYRQLLLARSTDEFFPQDAIEEINQERNNVEGDIPPCRVEIVIGIKGNQKIFVVLPTGVSLDLPFCVNAPFIQDPARYHIKEPSISPTNRWLLERAGRLANQVFCGRLANTSYTNAERAASYDALPRCKTNTQGVHAQCTDIIKRSFFNELGDKPLLLGCDGTLWPKCRCFSVPKSIHGIWDSPTIEHFFSIDDKRLISSYLSEHSAEVLAEHGWLTRLSSDDIIKSMQFTDKLPPKPDQWEKLHQLWNFVCKSTNRYGDSRPKQIPIVPIRGSVHLHRAKNVIRLPVRCAQLTADDWNYLCEFLRVLDSEWNEWLLEYTSNKKNAGLVQEDPALALFDQLGYRESSTVDTIVSHATKRFFAKDNVSLDVCVRFTHVIAALGAKTPDDFKYFTRDGILRDASSSLVYDPQGIVEELTPADWGQSHILNDAYGAAFHSCSAQTWYSWVAAKQSQLHVSLPIVFKSAHFHSEKDFEDTLKQRGIEKPIKYPYKQREIVLMDWGFDQAVLNYWAGNSDLESTYFLKAIVNLLSGPAFEWSDKVYASGRQARYDYYKPIEVADIPAEWIVQLRGQRCLPNVNGVPCLPVELLMRTPDTEPLMGIEPFVQSDLDVPRNRPLLELLGVRSTPSSSIKVIERLHALSKIPNPLGFIVDISKLYEALDRIVVRSSPADLKITFDGFGDKAIILSETGEWMTAGMISIFAGEDNQAPVIHHAFQSLAMWPRLGVPERPAFEKTLEWLSKLQSSGKMDAASSNRLRTILKRDPQRIWRECGHWLSLDQTWEPAHRLRNRQTMQNMAKWDGLTPAVKQATADLRMLSEVVWQQSPFDGLRDLSQVVEFQVTQIRESGYQANKSWLSELGNGLSRVRLEDEERTAHVRRIAGRLRQTVWKPFHHLEVTPYVDGTPAGAPILPRVLWQAETLYVAGNVSVAKIHKELADELARPFGHRAVQEAITACIEHDANYVSDYLADQFQMDEEVDILDVVQNQVDEVKEVSGREVMKTDIGTEKTIETVAISPESNSADGSIGDITAVVEFNDETGGPGEEDHGAAEDNDGSDNGKSISTDGERPDSTKIRKPPAPPKPDLMDRYAAKQGFKWQAGEKSYCHPDGRWIEKTEALFHWVEISSNGHPTRRLWVQDQTLTGGIEVPAEVWSLIQSEPKICALLVTDELEVPVALTGEELAELQAQRMITLYPSRYRIVENQ